MADELPAFDDIPSFDDLPDAPQAQASASSSAVPNFDDIPDFDALPDNQTSGRPTPESAAGTALRSGAHAVIPGVGGLAGMEGGAIIGGAVAGPLGALAGGVIGGVAASMATRKVQDVALDAAGFDDSQQLAANNEAHPYAALGGELVGGGLGMSPVAEAGKQVIQRGAGAVLGAGFEAGQEFVQGEEFDPTKLAMSAAAGAAFPGVNRAGQKVTGAVRSGVDKFVAGRPNRSQSPASDQAHADMGDADAEVSLDNSSLYATPDNPQPTTGNPQSAPARSERNYGKAKPAAEGEGTTLTEGHIAPDINAALATEEPAAAAPQAGGAASPIPGFDDHPSGVGQAPRAPSPVRSDAGLLDASQAQRQAEGAVREKLQAQQLDQEPPAPSLDVDRPAAPVVPPKAAAAINQSKSKLGLKKMPEPSVEAGFPAPGEPVAAGANDVPKAAKKRRPAGLMPAIRDVDGNIRVGPPGSLHADLTEAPNAPFSWHSDQDIGFATPDGKYLTRTEAAVYASKNKIARNDDNRSGAWPETQLTADELQPSRDMPEIRGRAAEPTEGQKEAGNYTKARAQDFGKPQAIETHAGQVRKGVGPDGTPWENVSPYDYGYFNKTVGKDKDHVDFARPHPEDTEHLGDKHFVIDQKDAATGKFDEHKVFSYYKDEAAARDHFAKGFSDGVDRLGGIKEVTRPELVKLLAKATKRAWNAPYSMETAAPAAAGKKPAVERAVVKDLLTKLDAAGMKDKADAIRALPEDKILAGIAGKRTRKYGVGTGDSAGYPVEGLLNSEGKPVTANTKIKAQERGAKHKEVQNWFEESKPPSQMDASKETNGELLDRIKPGPGRGDLEGWKPTHKPAEWLWAREASKLLKKPTPAAIEKFKEAERMLRGSKEDVDNYRGGNRIEADIARSKRSGDDAVANAEANNVDHGRNNVEDEMIDAIDAKRTPVNKASDIVKAEANKGKAVDVNDSSLAKVDTKAIDRTVNAAAAKRKAEAAALAGKKAATANAPSEDKAAGAVKQIKVVDAAEKARIMEALNAATKKAASRDASLDITAPIEKTNKGGNDLVDMVRRFSNDEGGSLDVNKIAADLRDALKTTEPKTYIAKKSNGAHDDYIRSISEDLHKINQEDKNHAIGIKQAIEQMPKELDAPMRERLFHARDADSANVDLPNKQAGKTNIESLPTREQELYNEHLKPILDQNDQFVANIRAIDPDRMGPDIANHISRIVKGETDKYNVLSDNDPTQPMHSGIGVNADAAKTRKYYALEDQATGARHVISPTDTGFVKWDKFKREQIKDPNFDFEDGKAYEAGKNKFTMRQATVKEIEANARGLDGGKKPMKYYKDAGMAAAIPNLQLGSMARHLAELDRIRKTPEFEKLSTTNRKTADDRGWKESNLPNFKGTFLHPDLKAVFDDYAGHPTNSLRDLNNWVTKALFWMPTAHINNVGTHWFVGRGFDNVTPAGIRSLLVDTPKAIKSVVNQDAFQREMRSAGAGTVYGGVVSRDMVGQIGKAFQQDVKKNPAEWNIMAKKLGVDLGDMANAIYNASSKVMWAANDVFLTQRVMELQRKGKDLKTAIYETEKDIPNYRIPIKVIGAGEKGRMVSRALQDPLITSFGRYHYGMMNSYAGIVKDALGPNRTAGDRIQAIGKMMALGLLVTAVYPILDKVAKTLSGNDDATAQRRGPVSIPYHIYKALTGTEDAASALRGTLTLPPLTTTMLETLSNKDFRGKPIVEPGTMARAGKGSAQAAGEAVVQEGEHFARGMVSPLNTLETAVAKTRPGESKWRGPIRGVVDQAADIKDPSPRAVQYERKAPITNLRNERVRDRQGGSGFIEGLYNKATKN